MLVDHGLAGLHLVVVVGYVQYGVSPSSRKTTAKFDSFYVLLRDSLDNTFVDGLANGRLGIKTTTTDRRNDLNFVELCQVVGLFSASK